MGWITRIRRYFKLRRLRKKRAEAMVHLARIRMFKEMVEEYREKLRKEYGELPVNPVDSCGLAVNYNEAIEELNDFVEDK